MNATHILLMHYWTVLSDVWEWASKEVSLRQFSISLLTREARLLYFNYYFIITSRRLGLASSLWKVLPRSLVPRPSDVSDGIQSCPKPIVSRVVPDKK
jgi:hypothetical protein